MSGWIMFWKWACIVGIGSFFVMVLLVIPHGAADIVRLFRDLGRGGEGRAEEKRP
jgi:hypothetical protein